VAEEFLMSASQPDGNGKPASSHSCGLAPADAGKAADLGAAETVPPPAPPNPGASETPTLPPRADAGEQMAERETIPPAAGSLQQAPETRTLPPRPDANPDAGIPGPVSIPGFEVLGELGRGGMGVVYKARQTKLGRLVALKMILTGGHASEADLTRFVTEAESIARLQHPNIVQIYEVGEFGGLPFFSLEFCPGGSLDKKLAGTPMSPREAAALVETLARAMQAAHDKGVIHRDLKPANVLLAEDGTPKVTDFGLAKKLDDAAGQTASGAIMGTPSYMAPEQAGGKSKDIGPHTDVYTLGAILYELLTGRPPFRAATSLDTIMQVVSDEPVSPRQLQSKTPPDLETVCLKCLQKEPRKRYATAEELAQDLRRFQAGEPIQARPVGRVERAAKWVRRNPVLAGMAAVVVLALLGGTAVSTGFGIVAWRQAESAKNNAADALAKGEKLAAANENLTRTANDLERSRDKLEMTLARSLIRPLGLQGGNTPMSAPEWEALWEMATNRPGRLGYRFVQEASRTPVTSRQLRDRASMALPAAVGLDAEQRGEIERLLMARLDDPALDDDQKTALALAAAAWDGLSSSAASPTARHLTRAMSDARDPLALPALARGLSALMARTDARDAATTAAQAAATVAQAIKDADPSNSYALRQLVEALSALAARMDPKDAAGIAAQATPTLVQAIKDPKSIELRHLVLGLSTLAVHMDAKDAAQAAGVIIQAMKDPKNSYALRELVQVLSALAARMNAEDAASAAAQAAPTLVQAFKQTREPFAPSELALDLQTLVARMDDRDATNITAQAVATLLQAIKDTKNSNDIELSRRVGGVRALAGRLDTQDAARFAVGLVRAMQNAKNPFALNQMALSLSVLPARIDAKDAAQAAISLVRAMKDNEKDPVALESLARGLPALVAFLDAKDAADITAQAAATLGQAMKHTNSPYSKCLLAVGLSALASRKDAKDAAEAASTLLQAIKDNKNPFVLSLLARGLPSVAGWVVAKDAAQAATSLARAIKDSKDPGVSESLAKGLSALAARMDARDAAQVAATLAQTMRDTKYLFILPWLAGSLSALTARMEAKEAAAVISQAAPVLVQAMHEANWLAPDLSGLLSAVPPSEITTRPATAASAVAFPAGTGHPLNALPLVILTAEPRSCRLPTQQLIELLKMPTCVGTARRVILDQLGSRYRRTFADPWQFVRFAQEQHLDLDFTSPPQRPEPAGAATTRP
jgi:tRNA A-37 threonylcarbamoyl transferase component Bud32